MKDNYSIRIDPQLHDEAVKILATLGLTFSAGIDIFLKYVVRKRGIPFDLRLEPGEMKKIQSSQEKEVNRK